MSGIPQGSVLGPILFVLYINDLPDIITSSVKIFADDTKIYGPANTPQGTDRIQNDLDSVAEWSQLWQMPFNEKKCKVLHIGKKNRHEVYNMNNEELESIQEEKTWGYTLTVN